MGTKQEIKKYLFELKRRLEKEMPKVRKEIRIYENKVVKGQLTKNPVSGPQYNA